MGRPAGTFRHGANGAYGAAVRRLHFDDVLLNLEILCARPRVDETLLHPALSHIPIGRIISTASSMLSRIKTRVFMKIIFYQRSIVAFENISYVTLKF